MFPDHVETERLHLRRFDAAVDLDAAVEHFGREGTVPEEMEYITQEPHDTRKETFDELREFEENWEDGEAATYAIYPKEGEQGAGELAGDTVLMPQWDRRAAYFGVRLREPFWGRGYSGERAAALMAVAFDHLDLELVSAGCHPDNEQSYRAIERYVERFGGRYEGRLRNWIPMDGAVTDMHRWSVSRAEYESDGDDPEVTVRA